MNRVRNLRAKPIRCLCVPIVTLLLLACGDARKAPLSGVLITIDTTNKAALGLYGNQPVISPHLDALAEESLVYENARSVAPLTLPSHASMLTGLYPIRHTVRDNGFHPLPASARTLAERAQEGGFQTAAFVAAIVLAAPFGLNQGFDRYEAPHAGEHNAEPYMREHRAEVMTRAALEWVRQRDRSRPLFLWVHFFDPHAPYKAAPAFLDRVAPHTPEGIAPYLAEVAQADAAIGELLEGLRDQGILDESLLAVVADHGESLMRHGEPTHSVFIYDTTMRVPFLLRYPDGYRAGERSDEPVSVVDLFPTFSSAMNLGEPGNDVDGLDLFEQVVPPDRGVYFESYSGFLSYGWSPLTGWADRRGTYLHGARPQLYLPDDRRQAVNRIDSQPELAREHRSQISRLADRLRLPPSSRTLDTEFAGDLLSLGYVGGAQDGGELPHPLQVEQYPDPSEHLDELLVFYHAASQAAMGHHDEAIAILEGLLETVPDNVLAAEVLARILVAQGRFQEIVDLLQPRLSPGAERRSGLSMLAGALERTDRTQAALDLHLRGLALWPDDRKFLKGAIRTLRRLGREPEAQQLEQRLQEIRE